MNNRFAALHGQQAVEPCLLVGSGVGLVLMQPDLGTSLVIFAIFFTMVLFEGVRWSHDETLADVKARTDGTYTDLRTLTDVDDLKALRLLRQSVPL